MRRKAIPCLPDFLRLRMGTRTRTRTMRWAIPCRPIWLSRAGACPAYLVYLRCTARCTPSRRQACQLLKVLPDFQITFRHSWYFLTFRRFSYFQNTFAEHICILLRYFQTSRNPLKKNQNGAKLERARERTPTHLNRKSKCTYRHEELFVWEEQVWGPNNFIYVHVQSFFSRRSYATKYEEVKAKLKRRRSVQQFSRYIKMDQHWKDQGVCMGKVWPGARSNVEMDQSWEDQRRKGVQGKVWLSARSNVSRT